MTLDSSLDNGSSIQIWNSFQRYHIKFSSHKQNSI